MRLSSIMPATARPSIPSTTLSVATRAGFAQAAIEADHPGCVAMTLIGCGGDANPLRGPGNPVAAAHGRSIADEDRALHAARAMDRLPTLPAIAFQRLRLPFDTLPDARAARAALAGRRPARLQRVRSASQAQSRRAAPAATCPIRPSDREFRRQTVDGFLAG